MKVYHMSDTLKPGEELINNYKKYSELAEPFIQALERGEECFYGMYFAAKFLREALGRFGLKDMQTDCVKWAAEAVFEHVRRTEFPQCCCRLKCSYYFEDIDSCRRLFEEDWGSASPKERAKIRLFEVELDDEAPQRFDMRLFDDAYDCMWETEDVNKVSDFARRYFSGGSTQEPVWEIASGGRGTAGRMMVMEGWGS